MNVKNNVIKPKNDLLELVGIDALPAEANLQLPDPDLFAYYTDLDERRLFLFQDVDDSLGLFIRSILRWNYEDDKNNIPVEERKVIRLYVMSYGGDLIYCMALSDVMKMSKTPIMTINMGVAASAGCVILMSGTPGYRYCLKHSWGLIHQGSSGSSGGTYAEIQAQTQNYKKLIDMLKEIILDRTKIDLKTYNKFKLKDWYIYDQQMVDLGIVDHIVENLDEIL